MNKMIQDSFLSGKVRIPSSKSDGQRALLCAALCNGESVITNSGDSDDELAMLKNIEKLGAKIERLNPNQLVVTGAPQFLDGTTLDCGESGLGLRLLTSVVSTFAGTKRIIGHGSVLKRQHTFFADFLSSMGVEFLAKENRLPFEMNGKLTPGNYSVDGSQSSQYTSGLIMAFAFLTEDTILTVENLNSKPYVAMTLKTLKSFGIEIEQENFEQFTIRGGQEYSPTNYNVESDWSSASYWLAASAIGHSVKLEGLNIDSSQADIGMLEALEIANCQVTINEGSITVDGSNRTPFIFDATDCPDLFPALVCLAVYCEGTTIIKGLKRLANKESDRGIALQEEFEKLGVKIELRGNEMHVHGVGYLHNGKVDAHNDHRIAMCLAIAGSKINGGLTLAGAESVSKSYPGFWEDFDALIKDDQ
jgi:3-phosphoshikimate 1-carboxyvinyltransferase